MPFIEPFVLCMDQYFSREMPYIRGMPGRLRQLIERALAWLRPGDRGDGVEDGDSGSVWDLVPSWQYTGRYAESGGLARDSQERALRGIQAEAEQRDPAERERNR